MFGSPQQFDGIETCLRNIAFSLTGTTLPGGGTLPANITVSLTPGTVTPNIVSVGASASGSIPSGAKGWTITFLSGTGTLGGRAVSAGFSDSDTNTTAAAIAYTTNANSSAYVRYNS